MPRGLGLSNPPQGVVGSAEAFNRIDPKVDQEAYVRFLEEARQAARLKIGRRLALSIVATDRVAFVADVAEVVRDSGMNIEAASHATVGGCSVLSIVASSDDTVSETELQAQLGGVAGTDERRLAVLRIPESGEPGPTADYSLWHLRLEAVDHPGVFHRVAAALAEQDSWLVRFGTTSLQAGHERICLLDLNVAVPPLTHIGNLKASVSDAITRAEIRRLTIEPIPAPVEGLLTSKVGALSLNTAVFLSVMGKAQPGLIAAVTRDLDAAGLSLLESTMAILEGRTVGIFAVAGADGDFSKVDSAVNASASEFNLRVATFAAPTPSPQPAPGELRRFFCLTQERKGVLASAARAIASVGANVECLSARVIGPSTSACAINMFVRVPLDKLASLEHVLQERADSDDWIDWGLDSPTEWVFTGAY